MKAWATKHEKIVRLDPTLEVHPQKLGPLRFIEAGFMNEFDTGRRRRIALGNRSKKDPFITF